MFRSRDLTRGVPERPPAAAIPGAVMPEADQVRTATASVDVDDAARFLRLFHRENPDAGPLARRLDAVLAEIAATGTYVHTLRELEFGARVAWRNSGRCIGRLYWNSLAVRDRRAVEDPAQVFAECVEHLRVATNGGKVRPMITVFAPPAPGRAGVRIRNDQLIRYAGYRQPDGSVIGDPAQLALTAAVTELGWRGSGGRFDVLPLVIDGPSGRWFSRELPPDAVLELEITHPEYEWFGELGLRWHAVPAIANMDLHVGGITYTAAPFNGWYLGTEIGSRNFADADRYDLLPALAARLGLDTSHERTLWRDLALVELNLAVLHSFAGAAITIADHHTESTRFLAHLAREEKAGRGVPGNWSWLVPPMSSSQTAVFGRYYDERAQSPSFTARGASCPPVPSGAGVCPLTGQIQARGAA
ncbi:MAG: nitric oxide synthase oxygenase [Sporichthyaceae bacterium]